MTLTVELTTVPLTQFQELTPRGKVHYHEDLVFTEGGVAKDFTSGGAWSAFLLEMKKKGDEDGAAVMTATVAYATPPGDGSTGLLDLDVSSTLTAAAQAAAALLEDEKEGLEGTYDLIGTDGAGEKQLLMYGNWRLTKGVSEA